MTKAALYYQVKNKEEILFQCHLRSLEIAMEGLAIARARSDEPGERRRIALRQYVERSTDQLTAMVALLDEGALSPALHAAVIQKRDTYERGFRGLIEDGIAAGAFVACDAKLVGFAILGAVNWIYTWCDPEGERSGAEVAEAIVGYLVRGPLRSPAETMYPVAAAFLGPPRGSA